MKRILLDQNVPDGVRRMLREHQVSTAYELGWAQLDNGRLLEAMERAGIEVLVTCDQNLSYQQVIAGRPIGIVVLSTNRWAAVRLHEGQIAAAVRAIVPGWLIHVSIPQAASGRRPER